MMAKAQSAAKFFLSSFLVGLMLASSAAARPDAGRGPERLIEVPLGGGQTVRVPPALERIVVGDPLVCDVVPVSPGQILLVGKAPGETQVTVWSRDGTVQGIRVVVSLPVGALAQALHEALPNEEEIQVRAAGGAVYLTGKVSDATVAESASRIAQMLYAGSGRKVGEVINLLNVSSPQQVQVHMRFVEITRTNLRNMGFNEWMSNQSTAAGLFGPNDPSHYCLSCDTSRFVGPANPLPLNTTNNPPASPYLPILTSPISGSFALSFAATKILPMTATLALLESHGVAKTLSEPTLVAMSGHEAKFLVGGEFPIPIPDSLGRITVAFKKYGAQIAFTPTVLAQDTINLAVQAEVSQLDRANGVSLGSVQVPALSSRQSSTSVRMRDGQSFAIAGLLSDSMSNSVGKIPLLGEIPLVGALFRSVRGSRTETELMVLISVNLVKPLEANEVPTIFRNEEFNDPNDVELFLLGTIDKTTKVPGSSANVNNKRAAAPATSAMPNGPEGAVGFSR
jgi:pilus assembly protein CpaC